MLFHATELLLRFFSLFGTPPVNPTHPQNTVQNLFPLKNPPTSHPRPLDQYFSNINEHMIHIQSVWVGAGESAFLTSFQEMLLLAVKLDLE